MGLLSWQICSADVVRSDSSSFLDVSRLHAFRRVEISLASEKLCTPLAWTLRPSIDRFSAENAAKVASAKPLVAGPRVIFVLGRKVLARRT